MSLFRDRRKQKEIWTYESIYHLWILSLTQHLKYTGSSPHWLIAIWVSLGYPLPQLCFYNKPPQSQGLKVTSIYFVHYKLTALSEFSRAILLISDGFPRRWGGRLVAGLSRMALAGRSATACSLPHVPHVLPADWPRHVCKARQRGTVSRPDHARAK